VPFVCPGSSRGYLCRLSQRRVHQSAVARARCVRRSGVSNVATRSCYTFEA
jgi:hypothetical protein